MIAFWLSTVTILASLGIGVQAMAGTLGRRVPLLTAVVLVLLGLFTIADRLAIPVQAFQQTVHPTADADIRAQVEALGQAEPPCCQEHED
jgi:hypothetical protein